MSRRKAAIVTIQSKNYGNRLQNYALQQTLKKMGFDVTTLTRIPNKTKFKRRLKDLIHALRNKTKHEKFENFNLNIKWSKAVLFEGDKENDWEDIYDYYIAGSDQIWNPNFDFVGDYEYLSFADENKSISYAASFGVDMIPKEKEQHIKNLLQGFKSISVREESAVEIVKRISGRDAQLVLDPVMLLSKEEWQRVETKPNISKVNKKYIMKYFLGGESKAVDDVIDKVGSGYEIIDIAPSSRGAEMPIGPAEFLWLIRNATFVITDSFHGSILSILFHTPFINITRNFNKKDGNMNTRIESVLKLYSLEYCKYNGEETRYSEILNTDFSRCDDILNKMMKHSLSYLENAMSE